MSRLRAALDGVARLGGLFSPQEQLQRFIYLIAALAHHARWGGLKSNVVTQLMQLGEAILKTHHVEKCESTLSGLWGELHLSHSQVLKKSGEPFLAAWEQQFSRYLSGRAPVGAEGFHALAVANRALRLGHSELSRS